MNENQQQVAPDLTADDKDEVIVLDGADEAVKKTLQTEIAKKRAWREKAVDPTTGKTFKALLEEERAKNNPPLTPKVEVPTVPSKTDPFDDMADNLAVMRDLTNEELNELRTEAKTMNVSPVAFIKSKAGQSLLKELRAQKKSADSTPSPSARGVAFKGKTTSDIFRDKESPREDKQAAFEALMSKRRGSNFQ